MALDYYNIGTPYSITYDTNKPPDTVNVPYSYMPGNLQVFGINGFATDVGLRVDDTSVGKDVLWTSDKTFKATNHPGRLGNIATFDGKGQLLDTNLNEEVIKDQVLDMVASDLTQQCVDAAIPVITSNVTNLVTQSVNATTDAKLASKLNTVQSYTPRNFPVFDSSGELQDSAVNVDTVTTQLSSLQTQLDTQAGDTAALVADVVNSQMQTYDTQYKQQFATVDNTLANLQQQTSQLDSGISTLDSLLKTETDLNTLQSNQISDIQLLQQQLANDASNLQTNVTQIQQTLLNKIDTVPTAVLGDIPMFDSTGQLMDSSISLQGLVDELDMKINVPQTYQVSNVPVFDASGQLQDSSINVTSLMPKLSTYAPGDIITASATGTLNDSGYTLNDVQITDKNLWSAARIQSDLDFKVDKPLVFQPGNVAVFDTQGNVLDGGKLPEIPPLVPPLYPNSLALYDAQGVMIDSTVPVDKLMMKSSTSNKDNIAIYDAQGQVQDSGFRVDDSQYGLTNLWTSDKTATELATRLLKPMMFQNGNAAIFDQTGQVQDSGVNLSLMSQNVTLLQDNAMLLHQPASLNKVATLDADGQVIDSSIDVGDLQIRTLPSADGNLASLSANGILQDSGYTVTDTFISPKNLYSNQKVTQLLDNKLDKVSPFTAGHLPMFDANGQLLDSTMSLQDIETMAVNACVSQCPRPMMPLVPNVAGSIATLGADGQLIQTSLLPTDLMSRQSGVDGQLGVFDASGQIVGSTFTVNDTSTANYKTLWSSGKQQSLLDTKLNTVAPFTSGNIVQFSPTGQLQDSQTSITNILQSVDTKLASQAIPPVQPSTEGNLSTLTASGTLVDSGIKASQLQTAVLATPSNIAIFDGQGFVTDSGKTFNDTTQSASTYWSSSKTMDIVDSKLLNKLNTVAPYTQGSVPVFGTDGQLVSSTVNLSTMDSTLSLLDSTALRQISPAVQGNLTMMQSDGTLSDSGINQSSILKKPSTAVVGDIATFDATSQIVDSGFKINDTVAPSSTVVYTSDKVTSLMTQKLSKPTTYTDGCLVQFNATGEVDCSNVNIANVVSKVTPTTVGAICTLNADGSLADSGKTIDQFMSKQPGIPFGHLASFDTSGQAIDSQYSVNDGGMGVQVLWSSDKITNQLNTKLNTVSPYVAGNFPVFDANGQLVDSTRSITSLTTQYDATYLKKPVTYASGNLVTYDANGQLMDSGVTAQNFNVKFNDPVLTSNGNFIVIDANNKLYDSGLDRNFLLQRKKPAANRNIVLWDTWGYQLDSGIQFDDTKPRSPSIAWTSNKVQALEAPTAVDKIAIFDANGQVKDSGTTLTALVASISGASNPAVATPLTVASMAVGGTLSGTAIASNATTEVALQMTATNGDLTSVLGDKFTCPDVGYYLISATLVADCNVYTTPITLGIRLGDGTTYREEQVATKSVAAAPNAYCMVNFMQMLYLPAGTTISFFWVNNGGLTTAPKDSTFNIAKLL